MLRERLTTREGTCGTAAFRRERVITEDIARARDPDFAIRHEREGQRANETRVRLKTVTDHGLQNGSSSPARYQPLHAQLNVRTSQRVTV
jgi:hypothetical protein